MISFQSKNIVKSDFFLPSFHQETVTVDQKDDTENSHNHFTGSHDQPHF